MGQENAQGGSLSVTGAEIALDHGIIIASHADPVIRPLQRLAPISGGCNRGARSYSGHTVRHHFRSFQPHFINIMQRNEAVSQLWERQNIAMKFLAKRVLPTPRNVIFAIYIEPFLFR